MGPGSARSSCTLREAQPPPLNLTVAVLLQFELFQAAPSGDLVVGECVMRVADVVAAQTVHSWFPFVDASDPELKAGELLMAIQDKKSDKPPASPKRAARVSAPAKVKVRSTRCVWAHGATSCV